MAILTYATYVPDVVVYATGCPAPTIVDMMRKAAIDFYYESSVRRVWLTPFNLTISTYSYTLPGLPAETEVAQIMTLKCQGIDVQETTHEQFFALDGEWPSLTGTQAQYYTVLNALPTFDIIPTPEATIVNAFNAQVALVPTLTSTGVEQAYFEPWKEAIVDGALSRLLRIKDRPWTDLKEAAEREKMYLLERAKARAQANKGNIRRDLTVQIRRWV
jgi:hypothetical protein